jgi:hypothetical protein
VVEPYNATLSIHQLIENSDHCFTLDNEVGACVLFVASRLVGRGFYLLTYLHTGMHVRLRVVCVLCSLGRQATPQRTPTPQPTTFPINPHSPKQKQTSKQPTNQLQTPTPTGAVRHLLPHAEAHHAYLRRPQPPRLRCVFIAVHAHMGVYVLNVCGCMYVYICVGECVSPYGHLNHLVSGTIYNIYMWGVVCIYGKSQPPRLRCVLRLAKLVGGWLCAYTHVCIQPTHPIA